MADINDIYGGGVFMSAKSVRDGMLEGKILTISSWEVVEFDENQKKKLRLAFDEAGEQLVLNATNANILKDAWGSDYTGWIGHRLVLSLIKVKFQKEMVDSIQVKPVK